MSEAIVNARKVMREAFAADEGFKLTNTSTIACILMDRIPGLKRGQKAIDLRNAVAEEILDRIFSE